MSSILKIMDQIEPEHPELFDLKFGKNSEYDFVYSLSSTNINQSTPNLVKMYVIIDSQMSSILKIMDQHEPEHPELFDLEFGKISESDFVYTLVSANIDQRAPNLVKMYVTIRSRMSSIMDLIKPEMSELSGL